MLGKKVRVKDKVGTVSDKYKTPCGSEVVIIDLENGEKIKAFASDVEIIPDEPEKITRESEITITLEEYTKTLVQCAVRVSKGDIMVGMLFTEFGSYVGKELFNKEAEND